MTYTSGDRGESTPLKKDTSQWGAIFDALSNPYRHQPLVALLRHNPQDDEDPDPLDLVGEADENVEQLQMGMYHSHLPKLADLGFIEWDPDENEIRKGPRWDDIAPLLRLIEDHQDELPDGWP
ncbi:hypothetical protein [Halorubrum sp. DM2]|uniref:DUF7344 domain-containing protein n=1 Tax=Halorubrum sp. DM2 TaxID=2527867 RepID=UPI0024B6B842|nr:hypothetical protein [Halorubrum sp. DM2]